MLVSVYSHLCRAEQNVPINAVRCGFTKKSGTGGAVIKPTDCRRAFCPHLVKNDHNSGDWSALCFTEQLNELKRAVMVLFLISFLFLNRSFHFLLVLF